MTYYFHVRFKDTDDIYIVRIEFTKEIYCVFKAKREAKRVIVEKLHGTTHDDFEIEELTLTSLLSQFHFVNDIAQLEVIRNP